METLKSFAAASLLLMLPLAASAQPMRKGSPIVGQANALGAAGVAGHLQSQGYSNIRNLRPGPSGTWMGEATRNGVTYTITANPDGTLIAH